MARVLVTGGAGLVGRYLVDGLHSAGYEVVVAGRTPPPEGLFARPAEFRPFRLDPSGLHDGLLDGIDHLVHAAFAHVPGKYRGGEGDDPDTFRALNLDGTVRLFEAARAAGLSRAVFLSSRAVYDGVPYGTALDEDVALAPASFYGAVKLGAERALSDLTGSSFLGASLRLTGVYGPCRPNKWDGVMADFLAGRPVAARAGSEIHGRDAAAAVTTLLGADASAVAGRSFNASDIVTDTREILSIVKAETGSLAALPEEADLSAVAAMRCDRLQALGWRPGGRELLRETVKALAANEKAGPAET